MSLAKKPGELSALIRLYSASLTYCCERAWYEVMIVCLSCWSSPVKTLCNLFDPSGSMFDMIDELNLYYKDKQNW